MKMFTKDGVEMMAMKEVFYEKDCIVVKGKIMQSINTSLYLRPEDLWLGRKLMPWSIIWRVPILLLKGWLANRKKEKIVVEE